MKLRSILRWVAGSFAAALLGLSAIVLVAAAQSFAPKPITQCVAGFELELSEKPAPVTKPRTEWRENWLGDLIPCSENKPAAATLL